MEHPTLGEKKAWTKDFTHIDPEIVKKFKIELEVEAGSAVLAINSLVHSGYQMKKKVTRELQSQKDTILSRNSLFKR